MFKSAKSVFSQALGIVSNPAKSFEELHKHSLEEVVGFYIKLVLFSSLLAGIFYFSSMVIQALYLDFSVDIDIDYPRMLNYAAAQFSSALFLLFFMGTVGFALLSGVCTVFLRSYSYPETVKVLMYALVPVIALGWVPPSPIGFFVWSGILFVVGVKTYKTKKIAKSSVHHRD